MLIACKSARLLIKVGASLKHPSKSRRPTSKKNFCYILLVGILLRVIIVLLHLYFQDLFRVKYRGAGGTGWDQSFNQSKQIAFSSSSPRSTFFVGLRVLARFNIAVHEGEGSEESLNAVGPARLMPGVIGELPMSSVDPRGNKNRLGLITLYNHYSLCYTF